MTVSLYIFASQRKEDLIGWSSIIEFKGNIKVNSGYILSNSVLKAKLTALDNGLSILTKPVKVNILTDDCYLIEKLSNNKLIKSFDGNDYIILKTKTTANKNIWRNILEKLNDHQEFNISKPDLEDQLAIKSKNIARKEALKDDILRKEHNQLKMF